MTAIQFALFSLFPIALAFAAANDLFTMRIPNKITLFLIGAFAAAALVKPLPLEMVGYHLAVGMAVLALTFTLFSFNLLGGGDAKLLAAASLWMGPEHAPMFLAYVTIYGGALSVAVLLYRKFIPAHALSLPGWAQRLHTKGTGIPYGIAIAAAGLMVYPQTTWFKVFAG